MKYTVSLTAFALLFITAITSCKKGNEGPGTTDFQAITFKFGPDSISINIDKAVMVLKNMPRNYDVTQLGASAILPSGYSISADPATVKDYTKGVTYTVTTGQGTYTIQMTAPTYDAVNNPYGIYNAKQLSDIRNGLNDSYVLVNDIQLPDFNASNAATTTGISDYADHGWYSIGSRYVNGGHIIFRGTLDGQNHVIKNYATLYRSAGDPLPDGIDAGHNGKSTDGIFGYATRATFKNIGIQLAPAGIKAAIAGDGYGDVGSLVGLSDSCTISNCFVTGSSIITGNQNVGGLIGKSFYSTISKSYASITPASGNHAIKSSSDAGGLIGWALHTEVSDSYANCAILGSVNLGGLIGNINTTKVKSCFASGNVTETPNDVMGGLVASNSLGGLIGTVNSISPLKSEIQYSYATGNVTGANGANSDFHKSTRIGGLIGQIATSAGPVSVSFCYATGAVSRAWTSATAPYLTGGLIGTTTNGIFITNSVCTNYWDKTTTGQDNLGGGNATLAPDNGFTANGKTTAEMKTAGTFLNWDFSTVWIIAPGMNGGYPSLRAVAK